MGYDGGFTKIRMKINTQEDLINYEEKLRLPIYEIIGHDNFYKFEGLSVNLSYLDNNWLQMHSLSKVIKEEDLKDYDVDDSRFTLITKDILYKYINQLNRELYENFSDEDIVSKELNEDIIKLKELYETFDWENDTLVFSYSY